MKTIRIAFLGILLLLGCRENHLKETEKSNTNQSVFITPLGKKITIPTPSKDFIAKYELAKSDFEKNPNSAEALIWLGRRAAYLGRYDEAIAIYSDGMKKFPNDARLYRHRGHRYISLRKFDLAINDLEKASELIKGTENQVEPDGLPNAQNIPVSTLHGNIYYHLGLAYYLKHDYEKAFDAYLKCRESGKLPDNIVSSTHWLYMIQRRLGNLALAEEQLVPIKAEMNIIENQSYYELCKLYKGTVSVDSLINTKSGTPSNDAIKYGVANWYYYTNEKEKAKRILNDLVNSKSWSSFGYIAAESDLIEYFD